MNHYTYRVTWSAEDGEFLATAAEFPSLSWLAEDPAGALRGLTQVVDEVVADLRAEGEPVPEPLIDRRYSGKFNVRVPETLHRELAIAAAEQGVSLNRVASDRLAHAGSAVAGLEVGSLSHLQPGRLPTPKAAKSPTTKKATPAKAAAKKAMPAKAAAKKAAAKTAKKGTAKRAEHRSRERA